MVYGHASRLLCVAGGCEAHDWLISDIDCNWFPDDLIAYGNDPVLISGEALLNVVNTHDIQFIWAVFSALPRGCRPDTSRVPYAYGNPAPGPALLAPNSRRHCSRLCAGTVPQRYSSELPARSLGTFVLISLTPGTWRWKTEIGSQQQRQPDHVRAADSWRPAPGRLRWTLCLKHTL